KSSAPPARRRGWPPFPACPSSRSPTAPAWCGRSSSAPPRSIHSADRRADIRSYSALTFHLLLDYSAVIPAEHKRVYARLTTPHARLGRASEEPVSSIPPHVDHFAAVDYWVPALRSPAHSASKTRVTRLWAGLTWPGRHACDGGRPVRYRARR